MATGFKVFYDRKLSKFRYQKKESEVESIPEDSTDSWYASEANAIKGSEKFNRQLADGDIRVDMCKDCRKPFILIKKEMEWYDEHLFKYPRRCRACRKLAKKQREEQQ